jgi:hypothetical protein
MMRRLGFALILLCALTCAMAAAGSPWLGAGYVRTEDRNGDGRPDVWRVYDRSGHASRVRIDVNFDGRSDVEEYYERGMLVRRESDRNFDGRIDLADEFDAATGQQVRSVQDVNFDGTADLLVLFRDGESVAWKWAPRQAPAAGIPAPQADAAGSAADDRPAPLTDPFRNDQAVRAVSLTPATDACVGIAKFCLPADRAHAGRSLASSPVSISIASRHIGAPRLVRAPRGPPAALSS